ncbi:MAG TPA: DUF4350 domain-containing protein [Candidatus Eremiobacteraceae bacterium]|nr:DUF4350 domain-containing protein [Candidatus Eremiobacteraceae bacterium]
MRARDFPWTEIVVLAIAGAIMLGTIYAGYRHQQAIAPRFDTFSSFDAHSGGYRAWYELLGREGMRVERFEQRPAFLDDSIGTLIVAPNLRESVLRTEQTHQQIGQPQAIDFDNLRAWVKNGGRLIWITDGTWDDWLDLDTDSEAGPEHDAAVTVALAPLTDGVNAVSGTSRRRVSGSPAYVPLIADSGGAVVALRRLGKGSIVVVTDQSLFDNKRLSDGDNARLAYDLAAGSAGAVAFDEYVHGYVSGSSWWTILPVPVRAGLIVIGAGLLLLLFGAALRFGPTARLPETTERTSAEYLSSMAQLLARGHAARKALRDLATVTLNDVATGLGLSDRASIRDIVARVQVAQDGDARASQLEELDRLRTLSGPNDKDLLRAAQLCAALRKEYAPYGRIGFGRRAAPLRRSA